MNEIIAKLKKADFKHEEKILIEKKPQILSFFANSHSKEIFYYSDRDMKLRSFKHYTGLVHEEAFFFIVKGYIAGRHKN
ncbi:hypothetical protein RVS70_05485 [Virgibacillus sp. M23]|uniref:hypothetical protein n=1 Tax=Virgibacillus sp. M23 TaxID=3079030 RepID=UPI002A91E85E|nr:hypothetical protein [Virgibacillus sp. M23]MDY7043654.1 hypothetical protein [Virgibacillus sp. M23]